MPSNRTSLELKLISRLLSHFKYISSNRTSLELKPDTSTSCTCFSLASNRTSLELKQVFRRHRYTDIHALLIAPVWN